jgi:hypothetical protein
VQRCTPEALEERTKELVEEGYVVIGKAEFTSEHPHHGEIGQKAISQGAEIVLYCDQAESSHMEFQARPNGMRYRRIALYSHRALYFARPAGRDSP